MASSEAKIILRADLGPVVEALQVLVISTRTVLAALQTALDNLEELQGVGGMSIGDTSVTDPWRCGACGSSRWVAISRTGPVSHGGRAIRQCMPCGWVSRDPVPTPAGGVDHG